MHLYRTRQGPVVESNQRYFSLSVEWDELINQSDLLGYLNAHIAPENESKLEDVLAPIGSQEVWAAGVTYYRSRTARMEESQQAGGGNFYDRVYNAERPELFFKSSAHRVAGPGESVRIRKDSKWNVPEPELTLAINSKGDIIGYTIGNDMSSRDIEGENPLYLPQAKVYDRSCALGPCILVNSEPLAVSTEIRMRLERKESEVFHGSTTLAQLKRSPSELVEFLFRDNSFPLGCFLLTGTGIVPPDDFTLQSGDRIEIAIDGIGTLSNVVA
ncbi:MAG TPA: fumarylacetoacetate hydrolase family protein [Pyrinomonadaceae bacterium]|nr:fumarylacetoacetate hydrolase family protein [Pyrinomonadaceae bacterium]